MSKIYWTIEESESVVNKALEYRLKGHSISKSLRMAQLKVIPQNRQRVLKTIGRDDAIYKSLEQLERIRATPKPAIYEVKTVMVEVPVLPDKYRFLQEIPTSLLISALFDRGAAWVDSFRQARYLEKRHDAPTVKVPPVAQIPPVQEQTRQRKTRIGVVGLLREQFVRAQESLVLNDVELKFIDKEYDQGGIPPTVEHLILSKHISHRWDELGKNKLGHNRVHFADGTERAVVQKIMDLHSLGAL